MNLSGGQQARINLARAIYKDSEIYLLDDSLTALDPHVQDYIFAECIEKFLANKIVLLVSQTAHHIEKADNVIVLNKGRINSFGNPSKDLLQEIENSLGENNKEVTEKENLTVKLEQEEFEEAAEEDYPLTQEQFGEEKSVYKEIKKKGEVDKSTYTKYFSYGGGFLLMVLNAVIFGLSQGTETYSEMLLSQWYLIIK